MMCNIVDQKEDRSGDDSFSSDATLPTFCFRVYPGLIVGSDPTAKVLRFFFSADQDLWEPGVARHGGGSQWHPIISWSLRGGKEGKTEANGSTDFG